MLIDFGQIITADDKAEAVKAAEAEKAKAAAAAYLSATEWLVVHAAAGGPAVPDDVVVLRRAAEVRIKA